MTEIQGIGIGRAVVVGPVVRMAPPLPEPPETPGGEDPGAELAAARAAIATVAAELRGRAASAPGEAAEVLEAQAMMAEDPALFDEIARIAGTGRTAARAVHEAFDGYRTALAAAGPYLAARVADLDDVRQRVVAACLGVAVPGVPDPGHPYVLVAHDLAPADTAVLDLAKVRAFVTAEGGPTSHTAVLARSRGIPAVVGCAGAGGIADGVTVLVDAARGRVVQDPVQPRAREQRRRGTRRTELDRRGRTGRQGRLGRSSSVAGAHCDEHNLSPSSCAATLTGGREDLSGRRS